MLRYDRFCGFRWMALTETFDLSLSYFLLYPHTVNVFLSPSPMEVNFSVQNPTNDIVRCAQKNWAQNSVWQWFLNHVNRMQWNTLRFSINWENNVNNFSFCTWHHHIYSMNTPLQPNNSNKFILYACFLEIYKIIKKIIKMSRLVYLWHTRQGIQNKKNTPNNKLFRQISGDI